MKLEIKDLVKTFGANQAISSLSVNIPECQTLTILGPSGSGKSTLLRTMSGLEIPESGSIAFDDKPIIFKEPQLREHRLGLGIVFQSWNLFPHLTALENICLPLYRVHGLSLEAAEERGMELLKRFDLDTHAHKKPFELSGGQSQRVALIRAVAIHPKMLMLDEPTSALDPLMTYEVLELIMELKKDGRNFVLVTHHLHFAKKVADWVLFLDEGKLIESGPAKQVLENPQSIIVQRYMDKIMTY